MKASKKNYLRGLSALSDSLTHGNRETYRGYRYHAVPLDTFTEDGEWTGRNGFDVYRISVEALNSGVVGYPDDTPYAWIDNDGNAYKY